MPIWGKYCCSNLGGGVVFMIGILKVRTPGESRCKKIIISLASCSRVWYIGHGKYYWIRILETLMTSCNPWGLLGHREIWNWGEAVYWGGCAHRKVSERDNLLGWGGLKESDSRSAYEVSNCDWWATSLVSGWANIPCCWSVEIEELVPPCYNTSRFPCCVYSRSYWNG